MDTFGERLKSEREQRGLSIEAVSEVVGLDGDRLRALERNDFGSLPDESIMIGCLQAYAACLEVEADMMIEDYFSERGKCLRQLDAAVTDRVAAITPPAIRSHATQQTRIPRWLVAALAVVAVVILGVLWLPSGSESVPRPDEQTPTVPVQTRPAPPETPAEVAPARPDPPVERSLPAVADGSSLSIPDFAVGKAIRDRQLIGRSDRFTEGTEVWFWTLVHGGAAGDRIDHVWLHDGVETSRISLQVGGPRWRTYSAKRLREGSAGSWAVEARDAEGHLLARREFTSKP